MYNCDISELSSVIHEQKKEAERFKDEQDIGYFQNLSTLFTKYRPCIIAGCGLQMFQQLCGINTAMYYGPEIMRVAGFGTDNDRQQALVSTLPLAGINAFGSIAALAFVDKCGRRWLMLRSIPFICLFMGIIGIGMGIRNHTDIDQITLREIGSWCAAGGVFLYLLAFSVGMGSPPWIVNSEIYPLRLRGLGNSMATTTNWISNFFISMFFLTLLKDVPYGDIFAFVLILMFAALAFFFVYKKVPETKGLPLGKILSLFVPQDSHTMTETINGKDE